MIIIYYNPSTNSKKYLSLRKLTMIKLTKNKHSAHGLKSVNAEVIIGMVCALVAADGGAGDARNIGDMEIGSAGDDCHDGARMLLMTVLMLMMLLARGSGRALTPIACGIHPARRGRATSAKEGWV